MLESLQVAFLQRAFLAGLVVGVVSPVVGIFLVVRRLSLIGDSLAHVSLAGVATGLLTGKSVLLASLAFTVGAGLGLEGLRRSYARYAELAVAVTLALGAGLGAVLINLGRGDTYRVLGYLFGSLVAITRQELVLVVSGGVIVLMVLTIFYKELFYISLDEEGARLSGVPVRFVNLLFVVLVAATVTMAMRVVGVILVSSLMILPVAGALQLNRGFRGTIMWSVGLSLAAVISGLMAAIYLDTAPGGTVVLSAVAILVLVLIFKYLKGA